MPPAKRSNPGRALIFVLIVVVALFGGMLLSGTHSPALGLDLRGGTTVTLKPRELVQGASIKKSDLNTAVSIMRNRVNGLGVGNADVKIEGENIVVSVPGKDTQGALKNIGETAQLSIRQVYETNAGSTGTTVPDTSTPTTPASPAPTTPSTSPSAAPTSPKALGGSDSTGVHAQPASFVRAASSAPASPSAGPSSAPASPAPPEQNPAKPETAPTAAEIAAYNSLDCTKKENQENNQEKDLLSNKFLVTCGGPNRFLDNIYVKDTPSLLQLMRELAPVNQLGIEQARELEDDGFLMEDDDDTFPGVEFTDES